MKCLIFTKKTDSHMAVNNRDMDVNNRKPFGLRSDYVQITFKGVQIAFDLRKYNGKLTQKNKVFFRILGHLRIF